MWLNRKVIKKVASPNFYIKAPFSGLPHSLAKKLIPQVIQFLEGPSAHFNKGEVPTIGERTFPPSPPPSHPQKRDRLVK